MITIQYIDNLLSNFEDADSLYYTGFNPTELIIKKGQISTTLKLPE